LVVGAVLWTVGLFFLASLLFTQVMVWHPRAPRFVHGLLSHVAAVSVVALACMAAGAWQVRRGLSSVERLRTRLSAVHRGDQSQVTGSYPSEVQPVVDDLNELLFERERRVQRALTRAGDLAHGLKTPLAVLSRDADQAQAAGLVDVAASVAGQVDRMRRQIDYHLAQARAAAAVGAAPSTRTLAAPSVEALVRTLTRLHADRGVVFTVDVQPSHAVKCQQEDLDEMLGNLLDNACKWGRSRVAVTSSATDGSITFVVEDDGPGLEPAVASDVLRRGVRADEQVAGSGLGLAIVHDLAELYGGSIELTRSSLGGLCARLQLPA